MTTLRRGVLIAVEGIDGSGKSTQLQLLKEHLERQDKKVFYFHAVEFSLANKISRALKGVKGYKAGSEKAITKASYLSITLRKKFLLLDILRFKELMNQLKKDDYDYIISDRYFYDSVINILYLSKNSDRLYLERFIPKPDYAFYMNTSPKEIMKRDRVPEQGEQYLKDKIHIFQTKLPTWDIQNINASHDKNVIFQEILSSIQKIY